MGAFGSSFFFSALEEAIDCALVESTREQDVDDLAKVLVLLHQGQVGVEADEAEVVKSNEVFTVTSGLLTLSLVHVDLLWSLHVLVDLD
jgi:hypothetical protein